MDAGCGNTPVAPQALAMASAETFHSLDLTPTILIAIKQTSICQNMVQADCNLIKEAGKMYHVLRLALSLHHVTC
jgi:hypothetical protein